MDGKLLLLAAIVFMAGLDGIKGHPPPCGSQEFQCNFEDKCIPRQFYCDGKRDCGDNSDEAYCYHRRDRGPCPTHDSPAYCVNSVCSKVTYQYSYCGNGVRCIPSVWKCDGLTDCPDGSDELGCLQTTTPPTITDHRRDRGPCPTHDSPAYCVNSVCSKVTYQYSYCGNGVRCIPSVWKCDGLTDCPDGSDELGCLQTTTPPTITDNSISSITGVDTTIDNMTGSLKAKKDNSRSIAKWGPELPRIAATLYLSDPHIFAPGNANGTELAYELSLQMISKLALKKKITTQKLALFMNALAVSCIDLKDFFGVNLVAELRKRVNNGDYTNPFTYLTLCSVGDTMTPTDVTIVASTFEARRRPLWTDVQALATMAMACMKSRENSLVEDDILSKMIKELKAKQHANGTIDNARTTALVMQALIATNSYRVDFDFAGAVKYLVREAANRSLSVQEMYYILPVLKSVSFVNVSSNHCSAPIKTELQVLQTLRESVEERIPVRVSMFLGNEVDFSRNWQLKVPASYNFYQVLENIGTLEPTYKVLYSIGQDKKPYIVGIHKYFDNAEEQMFWFIFSQKLRNATRPTLVEKSPVDIQLKEDEELIVWYRSGVWVDSP